jgi:hypothetical protein
MLCDKTSSGGPLKPSQPPSRQDLGRQRLIHQKINGDWSASYGDKERRVGLRRHFQSVLLLLIVELSSLVESKIVIKET